MNEENQTQFVGLAGEIKGLHRHIHPPVPNPAPLGLIAFGLTTALLQMKHTRIAGEDDEDLAGVDTLVMGFAMFFGGLLQLVAGVSEIRRNNIFGYTAFCLYGGFWMSVGTVEIVQLLATGGTPAVNEKAAQAMLFMVSAYTFMLWVLTFKLNKTICSLFFLLGVTCFLLAIGVRNKTVDIVGGYVGIATSVNAFWLAFAELYNDIIGEGEEVISLGHWESNRFKSAGAVHAPGRIHGARLSTEFTPEAANPDNLELGKTSDDARLSPPELEPVPEAHPDALQQERIESKATE